MSKLVTYAKLQELLESIQNIAASEVQMKLRCSNGLRATNYFGCGKFLSDQSEVHIGGLDRQSSFCFELKHVPEAYLGNKYFLLM